MSHKRVQYLLSVDVVHSLSLQNSGETEHIKKERDKMASGNALDSSVYIHVYEATPFQSFPLSVRLCIEKGLVFTCFDGLV